MLRSMRMEVVVEGEEIKDTKVEIVKETGLFWRTKVMALTKMNILLTTNLELIQKRNLTLQHLFFQQPIQVITHRLLLHLSLS